MPTLDEMVKAAEEAGLEVPESPGDPLLLRASLASLLGLDPELALTDDLTLEEVRDLTKALHP